MAETRPYRAEHVGSFPRPERLLAAREGFAEGRVTADELRRIEDECVAEIVAMQERVGIGAVTDGEFRRDGWRDFMFERLDGLSERMEGSSFPFRLFDGSLRPAKGTPRITGRLGRKMPLAAEDFARLAALTRRPVKANLPTPSAPHFPQGDAVLDRAVYADRDAMFADLVAVYREEIADLVSRGCTYLQMDEVPLAVICDPDNQATVRARGEDPDELIDDYIDAINAAIAERPADMAVCVHMCRGNVGHGMASGGYEPVAERMFNRLEVDGFLLEYDTERAGDFRPLRHLPKGKRALLGLVSTKLPEIETADALKARLDQAARHADIDRLGLCPQCGFSSSPSRGRLEPEIVERKLARIVEVADAVWGG